MADIKGEREKELSSQHLSDLGLISSFFIDAYYMKAVHSHWFCTQHTFPSMHCTHIGLQLTAIFIVDSSGDYFV